ncbi:hypothetical protein KUCAC02_000984 [Chaenocephalus aceratus]|uniref:Uncharacterized protein n=1 Tax=Chaenocephalus aceratus TaxID=36190 RepID=A0ACB9XXA6_CHAAC|nr:hypothetical protein KUCAC02_000984 [Chaenocephalus aceratus]
MLALVCANVTSIFHRQTPFLFPDLHSPFRISAGLDRCCDAAERPDNQWEANRASIKLNASREYSEYSADPWAGYMPTVATVGRYRSRWKVSM